ncbi:MAG TPA: class I SAM-dependent methyltransferase, partial [Dehalococcoidia bacterium]|nr:class I SAM-dependent methyltransferase [Dehalococcoidia bacterium]
AVGLDYAAGELRRARAGLRGLRVDLVAGDASRLPFREGVFAAVICTETLEHVRDDRGAMREIARTLADGGTLLGAVPSHFTELVYWRLSRGYHDTPGGHVRVYRPRELARELRRAGLLVTGVRYVHFIDSLIWLRFCLRDFVRRERPQSGYEAAILLAVAAERPVAAWRRRLRAAVGESRLIGAIDAVGALVWPKSLAFVARREGRMRGTTDSTDFKERMRVGARPRRR